MCTCRGARSGLKMVLWSSGNAVVLWSREAVDLAGRELRVGPFIVASFAGSTRTSFAVCPAAPRTITCRSFETPPSMTVASEGG